MGGGGGVNPTNLKVSYSEVSYKEAAAEAPLRTSPCLASHHEAADDRGARPLVGRHPHLGLLPSGFLCAHLRAHPRTHPGLEHRRFCVPHPTGEDKPTQVVIPLEEKRAMLSSKSMPPTPITSPPARGGGAGGGKEGGQEGHFDEVSALE